MNGSSGLCNKNNIMSFPSVREQVELCRHIASQLVANDNARSKGANMFFKRVKKAHTWEVPPLDKAPLFEGFEEDEEKMRQKLAETLLNSNERSATQNLSLVLDPRGRLHSLSSLKAEGIMVNEHDAVSPIIMSRLIKDLESPEANPRAFELFSKRKQMSQEWELVSNGTRDPKVTSLTTIEEKKVIESEEKENKKVEPVSVEAVNVRRSSTTVGRKSIPSLDQGGSKRFSLLDPDYFVPAAGSTLAKSGLLQSSVTKAPLPWGVNRPGPRSGHQLGHSHSQTPEPVSHQSKILSSASTSASPAFSMIESSSATSAMNNYQNNYQNNQSNYASISKPISSSSLASSSSKLSSMSTTALNNSSNYGLNTAINNFNRNYYFNTLPSKSSYGGSATNLRSSGLGGGSAWNETGNSESVRLRRNDNYNKFCNSNNRKSACYNSYNYNQIMGLNGNQNPRQQQSVVETSTNPYANLPESILL